MTCVSWHKKVLLRRNQDLLSCYTGFAISVFFPLSGRDFRYEAFDNFGREIIVIADRYYALTTWRVRVSEFLSERGEQHVGTLLEVSLIFVISVFLFEALFRGFNFPVERLQGCG